MSIFLIICLLLHSYVLNAKPTGQEDNSFYDALVKNCPNLNLNDATYKNQDIFKKCKSWQGISETKELTQETVPNVRCLLYYQSFVSYCNQLKTSPVPNITATLVPDVKNYQIAKICQNISVFGDVGKLINGEFVCYKVCVDFNNAVVPECGLAYYFANYISHLPIISVTTPAKSNSSQYTAELKGQPSNAVNLPLVNSQVSSQGNLKNESPSSKVNETQHVETNPEKVNKPDREPTKNSQPSEKAINATSVKNDVPELNHEAANHESPVVNSKMETNLNKPAQAPQEAIVETGPVESAQGGPEENKAKVVGDKAETNLADDQQSSLGQPEQTADLPGGQQSSLDEPVAGLPDEQENPLDQPKQTEDNDRNVDDDGGDDEKGEGEEEGEQPDANDAHVGEEKKEKSDVNIAPAAEEKKEKPNTLEGAESPANLNTIEDLDGESSFFSYFMVVCVLFVLGYVGYHNRQKVVALMLEGKRGKRQVRGRRPNSANYHKLDSNLEEAISSTCTTKSSTHVIY